MKCSHYLQVSWRRIATRTTTDHAVDTILQLHATRAADLMEDDVQQSQHIRIGSSARCNVCSVQSWVEDWLSWRIGCVSYMDELWCGLPTGLDEG
jgi:hypothetical protein